LKGLARLMLGRGVGLALFLGGFWLLYQGFLRPNVVLGVLGGAMMMVGMWTMARTARKTP
jgi:membrane-bound ClpP family serine protease